MAVKNLQAVVQCVANIRGVVVTGMRKESKRAQEAFPAPFFSAPSLRLEGPNLSGTSPDNGAFLRAGRSTSQLGVVPCARTSPPYHRARKAMPWATASWMRG